MSRLTNVPSTSGACSLAPDATVESRPQNTASTFVASGNLWEQQRTVIGKRERRAGGPRLPLRSKQRSNHETRNIGIGDGARLHGKFCARAVRQRLGGRRLGRGWRSGDRHDGRIFRQRNDNREFDGCAEQRHVKRRRQCRGRTGQWAEPVRQHPNQPLTQRLDPDAGPNRQIRRSPASRGFFIASKIAQAISSLPAASCISRRRASQVGRARRSHARRRLAQRWRDRENASSPPHSRRRSWPLRSISR